MMKYFAAKQLFIYNELMAYYILVYTIYRCKFYNVFVLSSLFLTVSHYGIYYFFGFVFDFISCISHIPLPKVSESKSAIQCTYDWSYS